MLNITSLFPLTSAVFVFSLGLYVFLQQRSSTVNSTFFLFTFVISSFLSASAFLLLSVEEEYVLFWDRIVYSAAIFIPPVAYRLSSILRPASTVRKGFLLMGYLLSVMFLFFIIFTDYIIDGTYQYSWGLHAKAQFLHTYMLIYFLLYPIFIFWNFFKAYKETTDSAKKNRTRLLAIAFAILMLNSLAFLPAYGISVQPPITYTTSLVFAIIMAYAIAKYQLLNIRVVIANFLVLFIVLTSLMQVLTAQSRSALIIQIVFFIIMSIFGYSVVQNAKENIKQRDKFEKMTVDLKRVNEQLVELDKQKSEMLSIAAHQLRTPLTAMNGYLSLVIDNAGEQLQGSAKEMITRVSRATNRLSRLVNNLLNMSRIDDGRMQYVKRPVQINDLVKEIAEIFIILAKDKGLKFTFDFPQERLPKVIIDENKMHEVFSNLVNNAIKYTKDGEIVVKLWKHNENHIRFSVRDTGIGIPNEVIGKLFNKFTRADREEMNSEGAGLGLYVAYNIVHDHDGRIWADSDGEGKGSTFVVELKINDEKRSSY